MSATFEWRGDLAKSMARQGAAAGLRVAAEEVKAASNAAAPGESGHLVDSSGVDVDEASLTASVYYDPGGAPKGGKPVYAVVRHEALRQGGAPKYLERPLLAYRRSLGNALATAIRRFL